MSGISRDDLDGIGFDVEGEGSSLVAKRREGPQAEREDKPKAKRTKEPLHPNIITALVACVPAPVHPFAEGPNVLAIDPSVNHAGIAFILPKAHPLSVKTDSIKMKRDDAQHIKLLGLADGITRFVKKHGLQRDAIRPMLTLVEGHYWQASGPASASAIQTYCEAVGTAFGISRGLFYDQQVVRIDTSWAPDILMGRVQGGTTKEDRHAVAAALLQRVGLTWPEDTSEHARDALCFCCAYLVREGYL